MWLHIPSESEVSARVLKDSGWELRSPSDDPELWCYVSGIATALPLWSPLWRDRPWIRRLSGIELTPSQQRNFTTAWTSSLRAIRANPSASPADDSELRTHATCGRTSLESSGIPAFPLSFLRTWPDTLTSDSVPAKTRWKRRYGLARLYAKTYRRWASALLQECSQRRKLGHRMNGNDSSSWPTATTDDSKNSARHTTTTGVVHPGTTLTDALRNFPTPNANPSAPNGGLDRGNGRIAARNADQCLERVAQNFPTPKMNWATPQAHDSVGGKTPEQVQAAKERTGAGVTNLNEQIHNWATPAAANTRSGEVAMETHTKNSRPLQEQVSLFFHQDETLAKPGLASENSDRTCGPQLNPAFVCWLMGLPPWWTNIEANNCVAQEMQSYLSQQRSRLAYLLDALDSDGCSPSTAGLLSETRPT